MTDTVDNTKREHTLKLLALLNTVPALPAAVQELFRLTGDLDANILQVDQVISSDQALVLKLLRVANSAFYGLSQRVMTVSQAIVVLGFHAVQNLALGLAMFGFKGNVTCDLPLEREELWRHSLATACAARLLAARMGVRVPEEAFTAGLLHNIGQIFMMEYKPELYSDVLRESENAESLCAAERNIFGIDHPELGAKICEHLKMPELFSRAVQAHAQSPGSISRARTEADRIIFAVQTALNLARMARIGFDGECRAGINFEILHKACGVNMEHLRQILLNVPEDVARMESLFEIAGGKTEFSSIPQSVGLFMDDDAVREIVSLIMLGIGIIPLPGAGISVDQAPPVVLYDDKTEPSVLAGFDKSNTALLNLVESPGCRLGADGRFNVCSFYSWFKTELAGKTDWMV